MANGAPAWMAAVPCRRSEALHDAAPRETHLSDLAPCDRRELASLLAVALASTLSLLVIASGLIVPTPINAVPLAIQFAPAPRGPISPHVRAAILRTPRRESRLASDNSSTLTAPQLADQLEQSVPSRALPPAVRTTPTEFTLDSARRALKRVLLGSGQYRVQPFPTVSE